MASSYEDATGEVRFYEIPPRRLKVALALGIICLIYFPLVGIMLRSMWWVSLLMAILTFLTICMTAFNLLRLLVIVKRPALIVDANGLRHRLIKIPWSAISSVVQVRTAGGDRVGLVLSDLSKVRVRENLYGEWLVLRGVQMALDRYSALPLPLMKFIALDDLQSLIAKRLGDGSG